MRYMVEVQVIKYIEADSQAEADQKADKWANTLGDENGQLSDANVKLVWQMPEPKRLQTGGSLMKVEQD